MEECHMPHETMELKETLGIISSSPFVFPMKNLLLQDQTFACGYTVKDRARQDQVSCLEYQYSMEPTVMISPDYISLGYPQTLALRAGLLGQQRTPGM